VIRPMRDYRLPQGDRVMLKMKSRTFREVTKGAPQIAKHTGAVDLIDPLVYLTDARLHSLLSKEPYSAFESKADVFKLLKPLILDVFDELMRENPSMTSLSASDQRLVKSKISAAAADFLNSRAAALVGGTL